MIARDDDLKGQIPLGLVVLKTVADIDPEILSKILRKNLRQMINGQAHVVPSTIDDPGIMPEIETLLRRRV